MHVLFIDVGFLNDFQSFLLILSCTLQQNKPTKKGKFGLPWVLLDPWAAIMNQGRDWLCGFIFWKKKCLEIII